MSPGNTRSDAPWRARISQPVAIYVVRQIRKACSIIAEKSGENAQLGRFALQLTPVLSDLRSKTLRPIYRSYPDLENADLTALSVQHTGSSASHTKDNVPQATRDQRSKGPGDNSWIDQGPGLVFGAYVRTQLPPDVIDHVGGIEIVFSADDPSALAGKTIDVQDRKFFIRD